MKTKQRISVIRRLTLVVMLVIAAFVSRAQNDALEGYVKEALTNNEGLKQQQFQLEKSLYALREARSLFLPQVSMLGTYTRAQGGRTIDMPIGDLLNPVYATLNELTQTNTFPRIENAEMPLNPDNFYDVKMRAALPLVNAEVWYNSRIRREIVSQQQAAINVYKRELVKEVKIAYYQYLQAVKAVEVYDNAIRLLDQNIKMNLSLVKNGVKNSTALSRAENEKQKVNAGRNSMINNSETAKAYFNFLLNRPLAAPVIIDTTILVSALPVMINDTLAITKREEIAQLASLNAALQHNHSMSKAYLIPKVSLFADGGSQAFDWKLDDKSRYYMIGLNFEWNLFSSGRNHYRSRQAEMDLNSSISQKNDVEDKLMLQYINAYNAYKTALANHAAAQSQLASAQKYHDDQAKAYREGMILYIELLDAQNELTAAELQLNISQTEILIALAGIERCTASYNLNQ